MYDKCTLSAKTASEMRSIGVSLIATLYERPVTIALTGELGAGKTTLLQGLASALGIGETLTSPTYALEQRHATNRGEFLHLDLYRLTPEQSRELLRGSADFTGIRVIEWSDRVSLDHLLASGHVIHLDIAEDAAGSRAITCAFHDAALPSDDEIAQWRREVLLPAHIIDHCEAVAALCGQYAEHLMRNGRMIRPQALMRAARVHDLFRFLDFRLGGHPSGIHHSPDHETMWESVRKRYPGMHHEEACAAFLSESEFPVLASIVFFHGLKRPPAADGTIEQKILYYADKRVLLDRAVSLEERFADFAQRYGNGVVSEEHKRWYAQVKDVERELFPGGPPL